MQIEILQQLWFYFLARQKCPRDQEFDGWSVKYWSRPIFATDGIAANHSAGDKSNSKHLLPKKFVATNIYCHKHLLPQTFIAANVYCQKHSTDAKSNSKHILPKKKLPQTFIAETCECCERSEGETFELCDRNDDTNRDWSGWKQSTLMFVD